jgi:Xaa-Pro aminopeptidase
MNPSAVGEKFDLNSLLEAREKTLELVQTIASKCTPGVSEEEIHSHMESQMKSFGISKKWHPTKIRFGANTTKTFRELSEPNTLLKNNDLFFFDIGPVWNGYEGDIGRTFTIGSDPAYTALKEAAEKVFYETAKIWNNEQITGENLYKRASQIAESLNYFLDPRMVGHRVSDFPHALYWKDGLAKLPEIPAPNLWILEIHLINKEKSLGAFYEDLLQRKN